MSDDDDDVPTLPEDTLNILNQFRIEQSLKEQQLQKSNAQDINECLHELAFDEDWQLSQFWYNEETAITLAKLAIKIAGDSGSIALISCPTVYKYIKKEDSNCTVKLLEYDERFTIFGTDYIHYNFNNPLDIPKEHDKFDVVVMDPPFLSEDCLTKSAITAKFLAKDKIILCTGIIMGELAGRLLHVKETKFKPQHEHNLANEFACFTNFDLDQLLEEI